jgi:protein O-GlcNAc transferase
VTRPSADFDAAVALHRSGRSADAERACRDILAVEQKHGRALHLLGVIRFEAGAAADAIALLEQALDMEPDYAEAEFNLAAMLAAAGRLADAAVHYGRAAALAPTHVEAWARLGAVSLNLRRENEAAAAFRRVLELRPDDAVALTDLALICHHQGRLDEAVMLGRRAVAAAPDLAVAHLRLGRALTDSGDARAGIECCRRAVELAPDELDFRRALLVTLLYSPHADLRGQAEERVAFGAAAAARAPETASALTNDPDPHRRLRIGWLTSDFRDHPVGRNLQPLFAFRDRARFETVCYAHVAAPDAMTGWFRSHADQWRSTIGVDDEELARRIRSDAVDVMIYPAGQFDENRPQVAAWRPAPVQIAVNDAASSGIASMDYFIADATTAPRIGEEYFSERVLRLPSCSVQLPPDNTPEVSAAPCERRSYVTFASFNNPAKVNQAALAAWRDILLQVPESRLLLRYKTWFASDTLRSRVLAGLGDDLAHRVDFDSAALTWRDSLARRAATDIMLDTFPFSGATTTFETLWMGVPVVTLAGPHVAGRWSAAILHAAKLGELVAMSRDAYVECAVQLACDRARLAQLRRDLRARIVQSPLCDGLRATRHFERLLCATWRRWCGTVRP